MTFNQDRGLDIGNTFIDKTGQTFFPWSGVFLGVHKQVEGLLGREDERNQLHFSFIIEPKTLDLFQ